MITIKQLPLFNVQLALDPAAAGQTVTVTYTGTKKVKSVKAVKK